MMSGSHIVQPAKDGSHEAEGISVVQFDAARRKRCECLSTQRGHSGVKHIAWQRPFCALSWHFAEVAPWVIIVEIIIFLVWILTAWQVFNPLLLGASLKLSFSWTGNEAREVSMPAVHTLTWNHIENDFAMRTDHIGMRLSSSNFLAKRSWHNLVQQNRMGRLAVSFLFQGQVTSSLNRNCWQRCPLSTRLKMKIWRPTLVRRPVSEWVATSGSTSYI